MKKTFLLLFAVAITSVNIFAQEAQKVNKALKTAEERTETMINKMVKELTLTEDQKVKMKAVVLKAEQDREIRIKEEKARRDKTIAEIKAILNPEQFQKFQQKKSEMKENRQKKLASPPAK